MENLILDLIKKIECRKNKEIQKTKKYDSIKERDLLLISTGKIFEMNQTIDSLKNLLNYNNQTKKITQ